MNKPKLRVGLLAEGAVLPAWAQRMLEIIRQGDFAEVVLVVQLRAPADPQPPRSQVHRLLLALERFLVGKPGLLPNAAAEVVGAALPAGVEALAATPLRAQHCDRIEGDDLARVRARDLDVLVQVGSRRLQGGILHAARNGVWAYQHGDPRPSPGGIPGYWEVMRSSPAIESTLWMLAQDPGGDRALYRSHSSTHDMSLADNRSNALWKALHFVPRKLMALHEDGKLEFLADARGDSVSPPSGDARPAAAPANAELAGLVWRKFLQKLRRKWDDKLYFPQWFLLCGMGGDLSTSLPQFRHLSPPKDRLWADPFVVARDGKYYVFIEELLYAHGKGHISVIVMNRDGSFAEPVRVLEAAFHLSYPFIFEFDGTYYLVPESGANRTVDLYRCKSFPYEWEFHKTLLQGRRAVDATLLHRQGRWWMFVNEAETEGASTWDELFVYHSDSPLSDNWIPHRRNPVVSDTRSARPAGRLFERDGRLYRPSQDCSGHYGYGLNICEITALTEREYSERVVTRVQPTWDKRVISTHTLNHAGGLTVADGQLRRRR